VEVLNPKVIFGSPAMPKKKAEGGVGGGGGAEKRAKTADAEHPMDTSGEQLAAPAAAKKTAKTAKAAKVTAVQWDGNTSLTFSEVLTILCDDGGALFGRAIASRLLLKQLLCFGRVNKACSKILRENLYKLLLCSRDVMQDPGELRKVGMQKLVCKYLHLTAYIYCEYLYLFSLYRMITPYSQIAFITLKYPNPLCHSQITCIAYYDTTFTLNYRTFDLPPGRRRQDRASPASRQGHSSRRCACR
jgi:hypothetical protein